MNLSKAHLRVETGGIIKSTQFATIVTLNVTTSEADAIGAWNLWGSVMINPVSINEESGRVYNDTPSAFTFEYTDKAKNLGRQVNKAITIRDLLDGVVIVEGGSPGSAEGVINSIEAKLRKLSPYLHGDHGSRQRILTPEHSSIPNSRDVQSIADHPWLFRFVAFSYGAIGAAGIALAAKALFRFSKRGVFDIWTVIVPIGSVIAGLGLFFGLIVFLHSALGLFRRPSALLPGMFAGGATLGWMSSESAFITSGALFLASSVFACMVTSKTASGRKR